MCDCVTVIVCAEDWSQSDKCWWSLQTSAAVTRVSTIPSTASGQLSMYVAIWPCLFSENWRLILRAHFFKYNYCPIFIFVALGKAFPMSFRIGKFVLISVYIMCPSSCEVPSWCAIVRTSWGRQVPTGTSTD